MDGKDAGRQILRKSNIFKEIPRSLNQELFNRLVRGRNFKVLRIVSQGHVTPEGQWYDQPDNEWVVVLQGEAVVRFEVPSGQLATEELKEGYMDMRLGPGDYVLIPKHLRHRVEWTSQDENTVWLAIHFDD